jgi:hypothetical protein
VALRIQSRATVKSGRQYQSERSVPAPGDHNSRRAYPEIYRKHPGLGYRHVLMIRDVRAFISILPNWPTLSIGLNTILLAPARPNCDGFHRAGLVAICAQSRDLHQLIRNDHYIAEHRHIFERLDIPVEKATDGHIIHFTQSTLRAYQLLHVFLHELGHHHDRMTTRSQRKPSRGERFAELYARGHGDMIWQQYFEIFPPDPVTR